MRNRKAKALGIDDPFNTQAYRFVSKSGGNQMTYFLTNKTPGSYGTTGYGPSSRLSKSAESLISGGLTSPFSQSLEDSLLRPSYGPDTASETALLNSIMDLTSGRGAVRGLGAPTQTALAQSIAPTLVDLRQKDIQNLLSAEQQNLGATNTHTAMQLQALMELIGLSMPQTQSGNASTGSSSGYGIGAGSNFAFGGK